MLNYNVFESHEQVIRIHRLSNKVAYPEDADFNRFSVISIMLRNNKYRVYLWMDDPWWVYQAKFKTKEEALMYALSLL